MTNEPVELDEHRGMSAQKDTEIRRRLQEVRLDQAALRERQAELEKFLIAASSQTWAEAAAKARYLIELFAGTAEAQDARRQRLIAIVLDDTTRLSNDRNRQVADAVAMNARRPEAGATRARRD
jgi:hypothetical protein